MANGKPWLPEHTAILRQSAGRISDARIAELTGHAPRTVRDHREARGLPAYRYQRAAWTRRQWLMAEAAGLAVFA